MVCSGARKMHIRWFLLDGGEALTGGSYQLSECAIIFVREQYICNVCCHAWISVERIFSNFSNKQKNSSNWLLHNIWSVLDTYSCADEGGGVAACCWITAAATWSSMNAGRWENRIWFLRWVNCVNPLQQISQENGFSPVWMSWCRWSLEGVGNFLPQYGHSWRLLSTAGFGLPLGRCPVPPPTWPWRCNGRRPRGKPSMPPGLEAASEPSTDSIRSANPLLLPPPPPLPAT